MREFDPGVVSISGWASFQDLARNDYFIYPVEASGVTYSDVRDPKNTQDKEVLVRLSLNASRKVSSIRREDRRASAADRERAEELADRAMRGFPGGRRNVVHRVAHLGRAADTALGRTCGGVAVRAAFGAGTGCGGADDYGGDPLGRLVASAVCVDVICCNRGGGHVGDAAVHHEADGQSADMGIDFGADDANVCDSLLGCVSGPATTGGSLRVQASPGAKEQKN